MFCTYLHTKRTLYLKMQEDTKSYCKKKQWTQIKSTEKKYNHRAIRLRFASNSSRGGAGVGAMDTGNAGLGSSEPCRVRPSRRAVKARSISLEM